MAKKRKSGRRGNWRKKTSKAARLRCAAKRARDAAEQLKAILEAKKHLCHITADHSYCKLEDSNNTNEPTSSKDQGFSISPEKVLPNTNSLPASEYTTFGDSCDILLKSKKIKNISIVRPKDFTNSSIPVIRKDIDVASQIAGNTIATSSTKLPISSFNPPVTKCIKSEDSKDSDAVFTSSCAVNTSVLDTLMKNDFSPSIPPANRNVNKFNSFEVNSSSNGNNQRQNNSFTLVKCPIPSDLLTTHGECSFGSITTVSHNIDEPIPSTPFKLKRIIYEYEMLDKYSKPKQEPINETKFNIMDQNKKIKGRRIVDTEYVINATSLLQQKHIKICANGQLKVHGEHESGFISIILLRCDVCGKLFTVNTEYMIKNYKTRNQTAIFNFVWAAYASASNYKKAATLLSALDVPAISLHSFSKVEIKLGEDLKKELMESIIKAGETERKLALEKNQISRDGTPWIYIHCDAAWSKRAYGHSYDALSGVGVIIGKETGKILYLGVRNKFCILCARAVNMNKSPKPHECFKNFTDSSYSMEPDIIVEGFKCSVEMHGVKYLKMIADGDSCTFSRVKREVAYGDEVEKIECINHMMKNFGKRLYKLKTDAKLPIYIRKLLTVKKIVKIQNVIMQVSKLNNDVKELKKDISNVVDHVYDNHMNCDKKYCNLVGINKQKEEYNISEIKTALKVPIDKVLSRADQFLLSTNNNIAELFMAILSKYHSGKNVFYSSRGGYHRRAHFAGLIFNEGHEWQEKFFQKFTKVDVSPVFLKKLERDSRKRAWTKQNNIRGS